MEENHEKQKHNPLLAIAVGVGIFIALLIVANKTEPTGSATSDVAAIEATAQSKAGPVPESVTAEDPSGITPANDAIDKTDTADEAPFTAAAGMAPTFDLVRVEPNGSTVVAGNAAPGAAVTIYADGKPLATAAAGSDGDFVALFDTVPGTEPKSLTMDADGPDGTSAVSDAIVMLFPQSPDAAASDALAGISPPRAREVTAAAILRPDSVQVMPSSEFDDTSRVSLGSISYSETGQIELSGVGPSATGLRAYVDNELVREGEIEESGRWTLRLDDIARGFYQLRIDQIGHDGDVQSRVETPFQRDFPGEPRPRPGHLAAGQVPGALVTVQPGGTLWTLARVHYGSGVLYSQIFTANKDLIRDPNLIYPGQVLAIPGLEN